MPISIMSMSPPPPTNDMLVRMANDYSSYFKVDIYSSISKLQEFLEEAAAKLDELGSLFEMNEGESNEWIEQTLPAIIDVSVKAAIEIHNRIDTFRQLVDELSITLDKQELQIQQAEHSFGTSSFRSVFNYFRKPESHETSTKVPYEPIRINVDTYFTNT